MRTFILTASLVAFAFTANAQSAATTNTAKPTSTPTAAVPTSHDCLAKADAKTWQSLGLTADQTKRVQELQTQNTADAKNATDHGSALKAILSPEQFAKYNEWCKGLASKTPMDKAPTKATE